MKSSQCCSSKLMSAGWHNAFYSPIRLGYRAN